MEHFFFLLLKKTYWQPSPYAWKVLPQRGTQMFWGRRDSWSVGCSVKMERLTEWLGRFVVAFEEGRKVFIHDLWFFKSVIVSVGLLLQSRLRHFKSEFSPHFSFPSSTSFHTKPVKLPLCGGGLAESISIPVQKMVVLEWGHGFRSFGLALVDVQLHPPSKLSS